MVGSMAAGDWNRKFGDHIFNHKHEAESDLEVAKGFKHSKATSSDIFLPARPYLLNLLKQLYHLGAKCSNA